MNGHLKMTLSPEKTLITHSSNCARFLGSDIRVRRNQAIKRSGKSRIKKRTLNGSVELLIPFKDKIHPFLFSKGIVIQKMTGVISQFIERIV